MLFRSLDAPSAVVENTRRPGMSLAPEVPSTKAVIVAARIKFVPSAPTKLIIPMSSPLPTIVLEPTEDPFVLPIARLPG